MANALSVVNIVAKRLTLYQLNDQLLQVIGLADGSNGVYNSLAVVTANLFNPNGQVVPQCQDLTLAYVSGTNGVYQGVIDDMLAVPTGGGYVLKLDFNDNGTKAHIEIAVQVRVRKT